MANLNFIPLLAACIFYFIIYFFRKSGKIKVGLSYYFLAFALNAIFLGWLINHLLSKTDFYSIALVAIFSFNIVYLYFKKFKPFIEKK